MTAVDRRPTVTFAIPSGKEGAQAKAVRLAATGRVGVKALHRGRLYATVKGDSGETYAVLWQRGTWRCECPAGASRCAHVRAVQLCVDLSHNKTGEEAGQGARFVDPPHPEMEPRFF